MILSENPAPRKPPRGMSAQKKFFPAVSTFFRADYDEKSPIPPMYPLPRIRVHGLRRESGRMERNLDDRACEPAACMPEHSAAVRAGRHGFRARSKAKAEGCLCEETIIFHTRLDLI